MCQPSRPIPVIHFAGLTDTLVPYDGGPGFTSAAESFAHWRDTNGCGSGEPDSTIVLGGSACEAYTSCASGVEVELCSILASDIGIFAGHILYFNEDDLNLAEIAWAFLSQFTLPCGGGDPVACEEELVSVQCEGAEVPRSLQRVIRKKVKRAQRALAKAAKAVSKGKPEKAEKLQRKAMKQLDGISQKTAKVVSKGQISSACGATIDSLVQGRRELLVG